MPERAAITIEPALPDDVPLIVSLIAELARYERAPNAAVATEALIDEALFGSRPSAEAVIARDGGEPAGFALFFHNFSTWVGKRGLYLEDLFVRPAFRHRGIGLRLLAHLAALAVERDCVRFQWQVLDWNKPARDFYEALGAEADSSWVPYRITGDALRRLAAHKLA